MGYIEEFPIWSEHIIQKETTDEVLGGISGPSNAQETELTNRTQKINSVLKNNSIYVVDGDFEYGGQNIIFTTDFYVTVSDGDFVYWHEVEEKFYKAIAGVTEAQSKVVGVADVTNGRVIVGGVIPTNLTILSKENIYLSSSTSGESTTNDTGVYIGYCLKPGLIKLFLRDYIYSDPDANIPGLRTLGITATSACSGNDSRLEHTGDFTSDASGITILSNNIVTEAKQIIADNNTHDFSTTKHGYVPKGTNVGHFLKDDGTWDEPIDGGSGSGVTFSNSVYGDSSIGIDVSEKYINNNWLTWDIMKEFTIPLDGNYRIKWQGKGMTNIYMKVYKNYQNIGSTYETYVVAAWIDFFEDISGWSAGDLCQLYVKGIGLVRNFDICVGNPQIGATYTYRVS